MNYEVLGDVELKGDSPGIHSRGPDGQSNSTDPGPSRALSRHRLLIAATFTADPLQEPLRFWMDTLEIPADIVMAPYGQVMQELLDPGSAFSQNSSGFNILLLRAEDWVRDRREQGTARNIEHVKRVSKDLVSALGKLRTRTSTPVLVFFAPPSSSLNVESRRAFEIVEHETASTMGGLARVYCWDHAHLNRMYPVSAYDDTRSDRVGHIPYTSEYFVAMATLLARSITALSKPQFKVLAIDCDNTLWKGICGEDGATGIELTPSHLQFQRLLVQQHDAGMLLCLCSKNNASDVEAVFRKHPEMPLHEGHFVASRVNWESKSSSLRALSDELGLGLDAFIFVDDSALECAEVRAHCPAVLTLQFPGTPEEIAHFLDHVWAFDRSAVTQEARRRTASYKENRARKAALEGASDLDEFLASLELHVEIAAMHAEHLTRVAELIQRTNQFNLTGIRHRSSEIEALWKAGDTEILVVNVSDRFGDYGLVGVVFLSRSASALEVDTFVLSCRALGRGVEQRIVNKLGQIAEQSGLTHVLLQFRRTTRNAPASQFLEKSFAQFAMQSGTEKESGAKLFRVPSQFAQQLGTYSPSTADVTESDTSIRSASSESLVPSTAWHVAAYRLSRVSDIFEEIKRSAKRYSRGESDFVAPRTATETTVAEICADVLRLDCVSVLDDFLDLGGDSLLAVQVISRIGTVLGLDLSLHEFFEAPTVAGIASNLAKASQSGPAVEHADRLLPVPLSSAQQRLWFIDHLEGGSAAYHLPKAIRFRGKLDQAALQKALDAIVARHEALRTIFIELDGEPVQKIVPASHFALQVIDIAPEQSEFMVQCIAEEQLIAPFDLHAGPLIRGALIKLSEDEHLLTLVMHHIVSDGWSMDLFLSEMSQLYQLFQAGDRNTLPPLPVQYSDYAHWQREWVASRQQREHLDYWKEHLQGAPALLDLPTDRPRPKVQSYRGASVRVALGRDLTADLRALSRRLNLTVATSLYAAWSILLARLSGQDDIVVGMPVANRRRTEFEGLIGFFVNTLAVRVRFDEDPSITDLLLQVKKSMLGAYAHQDVPFEHIVETLQPVRSLSHSPIFQAMLALQVRARGVTQLPELEMTEEEIPLRTAQFDLLLSLQESTEDIFGSLNYSTDLFDETTIQCWIRSFEIALRAMVREPQIRISCLPVLTDEDRRQIMEEFNNTAVPYAREKLVHEFFEEQVQRTPEAIAVVYEGASLTYAQLNGRANQLARYLVDHGIGPDQLVGICVERSFEMVIGLLGILKAGGAYVPLDPTYPADRLAYMLDDAAPKVLLIQERLREMLPQTKARFIALDGDWEKISALSESNLEPCVAGLRSQHLAYVIYTSGSTGRPKGSMNEHRALVNRLQWMQNQYQLTTADRVLQKTPFSFDVSVWEFFWTLMTGARLVVARPQGHQDAAYLRRMIEEMGITTLHFVPSMLHIFLEQYEPGWCWCLRHILCSGEELTATLQNRCLTSLPHVRLSNLYGPTEAAVDVTFWECQMDESSIRVPIGRPIANTQMYVLDRHRQPVPIGVTGEIFIGGDGVGRGYLNRPELTAARFVPDPFNENSQTRLYRTGDLGRWRPNGAIEYLGRNDFQVKIRGFRIELGEIEAQLLHHPHIKEAVVVAREDVPGEKHLVAYVVPAGSVGQHALAIESLRTHLKAALPEHMVPSAFVVLERLPLSPNGKLDRRALPAPQGNSHVSREYEPPQGEIEETLAGIWQELLRVDRVGRQDNFFELGGHSLLIMRMMGQLQRLGLVTEVRCVFENPTLAGLAGVLVDKALQFDTPPNLIPPACMAITPDMLTLVELNSRDIHRIAQSVPGGMPNIQDIYPLAPLQEGLLFHHLMNERRGDTYVVPTLLSVSSRERLEDLIGALQYVMDRHDALRTAVLWEELPRPVQVVCRQVRLPVEEVALNGDGDIEGQLKEWMKPELQRLDPRRAPLLRLKVAADPRSSQWYVLMQLHHIVGDNTSKEMVIAEVASYLEGRAHELPAPVPYRSHVAQARAHEKTRDAEKFFRNKLGAIDEPTAPFGLLDVRGDGSRLEGANHVMEPALAQRIRAEARRAGVSVATLFHAAWGLVVAHTSGRDDVVFGSVLLGRFQGSTGVKGMLGMFINTLPLRLKVDQVSAKELVEQTQRELVALLSHEQASLAAAQRCSGVAASTPLFTTLLNFRHSVAGREGAWKTASGMTLLASEDRTNYPINMSVDDQDDGFVLTAHTDPRVDPARLAKYLDKAMRSLVHALDEAPRTPAMNLSILPESERRQVLVEFNATSAPYPRQKLIHELFQEQVHQAPDTLAVICANEKLTYVQLNRRANQLAGALLKTGLRPDDRVALYVERGLDMVVSMLGILKAGAAYVPLDVRYPPERLAYMLRDSAPVVVITQNSLQPTLPKCDAHIIAIDSLEDGIVSQSDADADPAKLELNSCHLAYVIYTSGSTGMPKGVAVEHRNVVNLIQWHRNAFALRQATVSSCVAAVGFDAAVWEIWPPLCAGATLALAPPRVTLDTEALLQWWSQQPLDISFLPTPIAELALSQNLCNQKLRTLLVGGDRLTQRGTVSGALSLINNYGPTESTVVATSGQVDPDDPVLHIGRPIANTRIYILDQHGIPVPVGVSGEIYIGGAGIARGYLNQPDQEAQRFIRDPFSGVEAPDARMYRTGDLGRWRSNGTIEFLGRNDEQIKIRGNRIELGEIEAQLVRHASVTEAAVIAREDKPGERRLVAYVANRDGGHPVHATDLRAHLRAILPEYMVPAAFVILDSLPLTANGKLDRRALPAPDAHAFASAAYEAPQGEVEAAVARIWEELLRAGRVGRADNFFELGGHSLLAMQLMVRVRAILSTNMSIKSLFDFPTLQELSAQIEKTRREQLLDSLAEGGDEVQEVLARVASMSEGQVQQLMDELTMEGRL